MPTLTDNGQEGPEGQEGQEGQEGPEGQEGQEGQGRPIRIPGRQPTSIPVRDQFRHGRRQFGSLCRNTAALRNVFNGDSNRPSNC
jgi:hypothetical protein